MPDPAGPVVVYTDGSCLGNPGPGGWAWAVPGGRSESGGEARTTNQRMEITAVLRALEALGGDGSPVRVVSDSTYVVRCFKDRWWEGWLRRNWRNSAGKPVANRDLWEPLLQLVLHSGRDVTFSWVKGHSGDRWNDFVDQLAVAAAMDARSST
ncbi:MAG TPA: ribonuclease H [Acidimicrobiia bacterium]|nr:ribonuclease H [Acidimicrobiia bacterium]